MERNKNKQNLNLIIIGHQHSGKSTVTGHLVCTNGTDKMKAIQFENEAQAKKFDKDFLKYGWVLEKLNEERKRGIVLKLSLWSFETSSYIVNVIDAPGRDDSLCETASGLTQVDCAVLVVSASVGEFETSVSEFGLTYTHALIAYTLGVKQLIVCVNKMDLTLPPYSQDRFEAISCELKRRLESIGYDIKTVPFIPISFCNDNVSVSSTNMSWYSGWSVESSRGRFFGKTLIDAIDSVRPLNETELTNKIERLPLEDKEDSICKELMNDFLDALVEEVIEHVVKAARKTTQSMFYDVNYQVKNDVQSIIDHTNKKIEHFNSLSICKSIKSNASSNISNRRLSTDQTDDVGCASKLNEPAYRDIPTAPPLYSEKFSRNAPQPLGPPPQYDEPYGRPYQSSNVITSQPISANCLQESSGYTPAYRQTCSNPLIIPEPIILPIPVPDTSLSCCFFTPPYSICNFCPSGQSFPCCHCHLCECNCCDCSGCDCDCGDCDCDCGDCDCGGCDCSGCDCDF